MTSSVDLTPYLKSFGEKGDLIQLNCTQPNNKTIVGLILIVLLYVSLYSYLMLLLSA